MNINSRINDEKKKIICYKIMVIENIIKNYYAKKPIFRFGGCYKYWKKTLHEYENILFTLYSELSSLIDKH